VLPFCVVRRYDLLVTCTYGAVLSEFHNGSRALRIIGSCSVNGVSVMSFRVCVVYVICFTVGVMICFGSRHQLSVVVDFEHSNLRCFMRSSVWIGSRVAAKLCGKMTWRVRFVCSISMM